MKILLAMEGLELCAIKSPELVNCSFFESLFPFILALESPNFALPGQDA